MKKVLDRLSFLTQNYCLFILLFFVLANSFNYIFVQLNSTTLPGIIYRGVVLLLYGLFVLVSTYNSKIIRNKFFISLCSFYFFFSMLSIINVSINPDTSLRIIPAFRYFQSVGQILVNILSVLLLFSIVQNEKKGAFMFSYIILGLVGFTVVFSLIKDFNSIRLTFLESDHSNYDVTSVFVDKNTFGLFMFFGSGISYFLFTKKSHFYIIPIFMLSIYSVIARCKTSAFLIIILLLISFLKILSFLYRNKKKNFFILLVSSCTIFSSLIILTLTKVGLFSYIYSALFDKYGIVYDSKVVLLDRFNNWIYCLCLLTKFPYLLIGYSERIYQLFLDVPTDNTIILSLISGGIIKTLLYLVLLFILFKKCYKNHSQLTITILLVLYGLMQDYTIVGVSFSSLLFVCLFLIFEKNSLLKFV